MSLLDDFKHKCVKLKRVKAPDGAGGFLTEWKYDSMFSAVISAESSNEESPAERPGVSVTFTIVVDRSVPLSYHDVFKRVEDGKVFRITSSNEKKSPKMATFDMVVMTAEDWSLPK